MDNTNNFKKNNNTYKNFITMHFIVEGTNCKSCENIIKQQALKIKGVKNIEFDFKTETGSVTFDKTITDIDTVLFKIEEKGYKCSILVFDDDNTHKKSCNTNQTKNAKLSGDYSKSSRILATITIIIGFFIFLSYLGKLSEFITFPEISKEISYSLLFLIGLMTGFHCISMCGGFVVSYSAKASRNKERHVKAHLMYALGKITSYTVIGAVFGLLGSIIAFTPKLRGITGVLAGLFLVLYGIKMLNIFPVLRKFTLPIPNLTKLTKKIRKHEHFPKHKKYTSSANSSALTIGLLNGLMIACGPLQAIYIMAAGTGSIIEGAKLLFIFALGTLPVMLGFGYLTSLITAKATSKIVKASGFIVIILGLVMINNGVALTGNGYDLNSLTVSLLPASLSQSGLNIFSQDKEKILDRETLSIDSDEKKIELYQGYQVIRMNVTRRGWEPNKFVLKKDIPVKWIINGKEVNGCNNAIQVPKYNLNFKIKKGMQTITFTPDKEGIISWSCWMGMIPGTFIVKDNIDLNNSKAIQKELSKVSLPKNSGCGCRH